MTAPLDLQAAASRRGASPLTARASRSRSSASSTAVQAAQLTTMSGRCVSTAACTAAASVTSRSVRARATTCVPRCSRFARRSVASMPSAAGDQPLHHAARSLSGSHQSRLSLYHWTVSARPAVKSLLRCVAEGADLGAVDRVAAVVAFAVGDVFDRFPVGAARVQEQPRQLLVGQFGAAADVVDLAGAPFRADEFDALHVVVDVEPVPHVRAVAVERDLRAVEQVGDEQGDDLLGEVVVPVVVRAAGHAHVEAVGAVVGEGDQVAGGLRRRVGRVRGERVRLGPRAFVDRSRRPRRWRCARRSRCRGAGPRRRGCGCRPRWCARRPRRRRSTGLRGIRRRSGRPGRALA